MATLTASDGAEGDYFGYSCGRRRQHRGGCRGVDNNNGAAYVFYEDGGDTYEQTDKLLGQYGPAQPWQWTAVPSCRCPRGYKDTGSATIFGPREAGSDDATGQGAATAR